MSAMLDEVKVGSDVGEMVRTGKMWLSLLCEVVVSCCEMLVRLLSRFRHWNGRRRLLESVCDVVQHLLSLGLELIHP